MHGFGSMNNPSIRIGTSAFTAAGWSGTFYPKNLKPADYLPYYAQHFDAVEIDSTFYGTPRIGTVRNWDAKTPAGFLFAAKVPQLCCGGSYVARSAAGPLSPALDVI